MALAGLPPSLRLELPLEEGTVRRYLGSRGKSLPPSLAEGVGWARGEALRLAHPQVGVGRVEVLGVEKGRVALAGGGCFTGKGLERFFRGAEAATLLLVTIGGALEERVAELFAQGQALEAYLLDAVGSAAMHELLSQARALVCAAAAEEGLAAGPYLQPGCQYWELRDQAVVCAFLPLNQLGVTLTPALFLRPRKSETAAIPLGRALQVRATAEESACRYCGRKDCPMRESQNKASPS